MTEKPLPFLAHPSVLGLVLLAFGLSNGVLASGSECLTHSMHKESSTEYTESPTATQQFMPTANLNTSPGTPQTRSVLIVKVIANDTQSTLSIAQLSDSVFGNQGDRVNLKSQYLACSNGKLEFIPATGENITDGVIEVVIDEAVAGKSHEHIKNATLSALTQQLGAAPESQYQHIMIAIPPGTQGSWTAYATINGGLSVYNDRWITSVSAQMHEIGHNLNLGHSSEGTDLYGDRTGVMGESYISDDGPEMCFNAAKSAQLGWYQNKTLELGLGASWAGLLTSVADHAYINNTELTLLKIPGANNDEAIYLTLNAQKGINIGTQEAQNQVTVTYKATAQQAYGDSNLLAKLAEGESFSIANFSGNGLDLHISVRGINTDRGSFYSAAIDVDFKAPSASAYENTPLTEPSLGLNTQAATSPSPSNSSGSVGFVLLIGLILIRRLT